MPSTMMTFLATVLAEEIKSKGQMQGYVSLVFKTTIERGGKPVRRSPSHVYTLVEPTVDSRSGESALFPVIFKSR